MDSELESKLKSIICQILSLIRTLEEEMESETVWGTESDSRPKFISLISQLTSLVSSLDFDSQPKPESGITSLIFQINSVVNNILPSEPEWEIISLLARMVPLIRSMDLEQQPPVELQILVHHISSHIYSLSSDSKLYSLITQIFYLAESDSDSEREEVWEPEQLISLSPKLKLQLVQGKFHVTGKVVRNKKQKGKCHPDNRRKVCFAREKEATHFHCRDCNGEDHEECKRTLVEVKHPHHPKHYLDLVLQKSSRVKTRKCFCCDDDLEKMFYYCSTCDFAMNIACAEKPPPAVFIDHPKWHEHRLVLFPRQTSLTCNLCALADSISPLYMCPPCDLVVHQSCVSLPRVIRISRHLHRISFTLSFGRGDWSCGICRKDINNDYGGYSCIKEGCLYAAHFRCATQRNVWDGTDLEGVPEDVEEEELEPFVQISDGIIQHFSHQHHLKLDKNTGRKYDDTKECQACVMPIYSGNFYNCLQCEDFILHKTCANLSRKLYHPIHPHLLTLVGGYNGIGSYSKDKCSACSWFCTAGFFYECGTKGCRFKLHVQCATISEPLVHESHVHPLFLTSKPGERRRCCVCKTSTSSTTSETFNCIECDFALCFKCATLPQKVMYKHDKHMLTLSYGKETSIMAYWCELCERTLNPKERFYTCDEYCCVTLHIECLIGKDLYMKAGSSCFFKDRKKLSVLPNNQMSRPRCFNCKKRCPYKIVLFYCRLIFCSTFCIGFDW